MEFEMNTDVENLLIELSQINGVLKAAIIDNIRKEIVCAVNMENMSGSLIHTMSDIIRSNLKYSRLSSNGNFIEDILITYLDDIHLLKPIFQTANYFLYINISRNANVALTRHKLNEKLANYLSNIML